MNGASEIVLRPRLLALANDLNLSSSGPGMSRNTDTDDAVIGASIDLFNIGILGQGKGATEALVI